MKKINEKYVEELYHDFITRFSYISVERDVVRKFIEEHGLIDDREYELDLLRDYVLAGDYADEIVL